MAEVGQGPVSLSRELPGFVLNRMQYALLNECWRLIRDGVVSSQDLDVVMKDGMGMRYAFMGLMETIHLNAEGTQNYCDRYGETIYLVSSDLGPIPTVGNRRLRQTGQRLLPWSLPCALLCRWMSSIRGECGETRGWQHWQS